MHAARRALAVVGFFAALTAVFTFPLSVAPGSRALPLSADTRLFLWTLSWDTHALVHRPLHVFDANIFYPEPRTLAYSEHLLGSAVVGAPFLLATGNPLLALNAVVVLACVLSGVGAYFLARQLAIGLPGALAAGIIFAFAPPHFARLAQVHLVTVQWIPFSLGFLHAYARDRRRRDLVAAAALFTVQATTSGHGGLFLLLSALLVLIVLAAQRALPAPGRLMRDLGIGGAAVLALNALFLLPYFRVQHDVGLHRTLGAVYDWSPNAVSFLAAETHVQRWLLSLWPTLAAATESAKAYLFPGWLTLAFAAVGVSTLWKPGGAPRHLVAYLLLVAFSLWASLGPGFGLYAVLYRIVPGFDLIRVPSRLTVLTLLGLAVLAGAGLTRLLAERSPRVRFVLAAIALAGLAGEFAAMPLHAPDYPLDLPAIDRWIAEQPRPFTLVELPVADPGDATRSARLNSHYMLHSTLHWQPIVNGYSGLVPPRHERLFRILTGFPDEASLRELEAIGVSYAVLHRDFYDAAEWEKVRQRAATLGDRLRLDREEPDGCVYALTRSR